MGPAPGISAAGSPLGVSVFTVTLWVTGSKVSSAILVNPDGAEAAGLIPRDVCQKLYLSYDPDLTQEEGEALTEKLMELIISIRQDARKNKNWAIADKIRDDLKAAGIALEDTKNGVRWKRM